MRTFKLTIHLICLSMANISESLKTCLLYWLFCYCMNIWNGNRIYVFFPTTSFVHWIAQYQKCPFHKIHQEDWQTCCIHHEPQDTYYQCMVLHVKSPSWNSIPHNVPLEPAKVYLSGTMEQLSEGVLPLLAQLQNQEKTREQSGRVLALILREVNFTKVI